MRGFIDIHGLIGVNQPAEYERLVREAVKQYPANPYAHGYMLTMLAGRLMPAAALNALLAEAAALTDEALKLKPGDAVALKTRERIEELRKASSKASGRRH
jgi:hypothetical protein